MALFHSMPEASIAGLRQGEAGLHVSDVEHHVDQPDQQGRDTGPSSDLRQGAPDHLKQADLFHRGGVDLGNSACKNPATACLWQPQRATRRLHHAAFAPLALHDAEITAFCASIGNQRWGAADWSASEAASDLGSGRPDGLVALDWPETALIQKKAPPKAGLNSHECDLVSTS